MRNKVPTTLYGCFLVFVVCFHSSTSSSTSRIVQAAHTSTTDRFLDQQTDDFAAYYSSTDTSNNNNDRSSWSTAWGWSNGSFGRSNTRVPATLSPTSMATTAFPSASPTTAFPSPSPTTAFPSPSPTTAFPTAAPTAACMDNLYYRDPVHNLDCYSFTSSSNDCVFVGLVWGGLTTEQVGEVLENCPRSCSAQYDCADRVEDGTILEAFTVEAIPFRLINGVFLGEDSIAAMEEATIEYLTRYLRSRGVRSTVVTGASVLYEEKIQQEQQQQTSSNGILQVSMSFEGIAVVNNADDMTNTMAGYIQQGLLNSAYSNALQYTGDQSFTNVYVSFQGTSNTNAKEQNGNNRRSSGGNSQREREHDPRRGSSSMPVAAPILAVSSILLVAATGYALQVMYNMDEDEAGDGIAEKQNKRTRKNKKGDKRRIHADDDSRDNTRKSPAAAAGSGGIIDVTQYTYDDEDEEESSAYHSLDDVVMLQQPAASCYRPDADGGVPQAPTNHTFDSYLDYHEDSPVTSSDYCYNNTRSESTDDNAPSGRQKCTVIPDVTFVDSSSLLEILEYKQQQQHPYDDVERQQNVGITASDSNISESLKMFVRSVGGTMDAAIQDIQQDRRYYR